MSIADVTTSGGNAVLDTDYTDATGEMITFPQYDAAMTHTVALTADTILEGTECFDFIIALTSDATTMAAASVSTNGNTAKIFIIDESCKYRNALVEKTNHIKSNCYNNEMKALSKLIG